MVGKYMNSQSGDCREEFDYWVAFPGASQWYNGTNKPLNVNCEWTIFNNTYSTYLLRDYALQFLNATITEGKPFVMWFSPFNPHAPATPAQEDANLYPNGLPSYYLPPSFNEADVSDKPAWMQALPLDCQDRPVSECEKAYKEEQLSTVRNLASFDRSVDELLNLLDSKGELSNTLIIYINDNGIFHGEHRIFNQKNAHYKESVKAIMGVRWDGHIPVGQTSNLVGNIDIAPTVYDALGLTPPYPLDGQSLFDLWRAGSEPWRQSFLLEHWSRTYRDATIVTKSWSYTETKGDKSELYHREKDPYELNNLWCSSDDPSCAYSWTITKLAAELRLLDPSWDSDAHHQRQVQQQQPRQLPQPAAPTLLSPNQIQTVLTLNTIENVPAGEDVTVTGKLSIANDGKGIGGRIITFNGTGADNLPADGVITNSDGTFTAKGTSPDTAASGWKVQARFAGDTTSAASNTNTNTTYAASNSAITEYSTLKHTLELQYYQIVRLADPYLGKTIHFNGTGAIGIIVSDDKTKYQWLVN
jgi:arylsulfatase A-like enzyme